MGFLDNFKAAMQRGAEAANAETVTPAQTELKAAETEKTAVPAKPESKIKKKRRL